MIKTLGGACYVGTASETGTTDGRGVGSGEMRAFVPVELAEFTAVWVDADVVLENVVGGGIGDGGVAVLGEKSLPVLGVIGDVGLVAFRPASSEFADFPGTVTGAVLDDETSRVRDESVRAGGGVLHPVGETGFAVGPGVGILACDSVDIGLKGRANVTTD